MSGFRIGRILLLLALAWLPLRALATPASGYWWNPAEAGRGFVIEIQGSNMFLAGFLYAGSGRASWVASSGPMTSPTQYSGPLTTYQGGQTLTGAFRPATQVAPALGTLSINFTSDSTGSLTWPGGTIPIQRFDFGPGGSTVVQAATNPQPGWWWNSGEGGRGFAMEVQGGTMYLAGYMYDAAGNTIWYLANGNMNSPASFQGQWTQFGNGQTLTGPYKQGSVVNPNAGFVTVQFIDSVSALLTLPNEQIQLMRFNFGLPSPVLSAFNPPSAAPNSLVSLSGSGIDPTAALTLTVYNNLGYSVTLPLAAASATSLKLSVPVYVNVATHGFASGTVNLKLTQSKNGASADSNALTGFTIQALPAVPGTPGASTLSLIRASLSEANRLQNAVKGTAQDTPSVNAALAQQVNNLLSLLANVANVLQSGQSFTLGIVGGVNISVTPANISQVDSFILATLQSLASPAAGSAEKGAQATGSTCMGAEAQAFASAMMSGGNNFDQLAVNLIEAPVTSNACNTAASFTSAYQIFGGAGSTGVGITNQAGNTGSTAQIAGFALFATTTTNADTALGLNALLSPQLSGQTSAVQNGISSVSALAKPVTDQLLATSSGDLASNVSLAQNLILTVAPPPSTGGPLAVSGTYVGSASATSAVCSDSDGSSLNLIAQIVAQGTTLTGSIRSTDKSDSKGNNPGTVNGTFNANSGNWDVTIAHSDPNGEIFSASGTINGTLLSGTLTDTASPTSTCPNLVIHGVFALVKQ